MTMGALQRARNDNGGRQRAKKDNGGRQRARSNYNRYGQKDKKRQALWAYLGMSPWDVTLRCHLAVLPCGDVEAVLLSLVLYVAEIVLVMDILEDLT